MKTNSSLTLLSSACITVALLQSAQAITNTWSGAGGNLIWHTAGNWSPAGPPGVNDDTRFFNAGNTNEFALPNTVVTNNTSVRSLWFGQTNGYHNLLINFGVTLTVAGTNHNGYGPLGSDPSAAAPDPAVNSTYYVGTKTGSSVTQTVTNAVSGSGTLSLNNTNNELNVRQFWMAGGGAHYAVLDMSGLDTFVANLGRIRVGDGEAQPITRAEGQLFLARTNIITLRGTNFADNVQLVVGNNDVNNNGNGRISYLMLGQQTTLNVDEVLVGGRKTQGNISFNAAFTSPTFTLRGSDGVGRVRALRIGDHSDQLNTGNATTGNMNLGLGSVNALVNTVYVGRSSAQQTGPATGTLTLGPGTFDVNTLEVAYQTTDQNTTSTSTGTLNVNGTTVTVNNLLRLGRSAGTAAARTANFNLNGGTVNVNGSYANEGTVNLSVVNGLLRLPTGASITANNLTVDGGSISNAASVRATNTLTIANGGTIPNNPVFDLGNSGAAVWNVDGIAGGVLTVSNVLQGSGNLSGNVIQAPASQLIPGGNNAVGTLTVSGNLNLNGSTLRFDLTTNAVTANDQIAVSSVATLGATNDVNISAIGGLLDTANPYTLLTAGTLVGDQTYFKVAGQLAQSRYAFAFDTTSTPNSMRLSVSGGFGNLTWVGDGAANLWNLQGAFNWNNGAAAQFLSLDAITFNDSGSAAPYINLVGSLVPGSMTVNNPTKHYAFGGGGSLGVSGELIKSGGGGLTLTNNADNSFSSLVTVSNGAVTIANNGVNTFESGIAVYGGSLTIAGNATNNFGALGTFTIATGAALTLANSGENSFGGIPVQLDGTFTLNQPVDAAMNGQLTGAGTLTKAGSGTLTLGGNNSGLSSIVQINGGRVRAAVPSAMGSAGVTIASGGQLNLSGQNLSTLQITAAGSGPDGSGAIVNNGGPQEIALGAVTLTGHTALGGSGPWSTDPVLNSGRMDLNGGALLTGDQPYNLTKVGLNQVTLRNCAVDEKLANIDVQAGLFALQGASSLGNPTNTISVQAGATVSFFDSGLPWEKKFMLFGNGSTPSLMNYNGVNVVAGPVTLNNACVMGSVPASRGTPVSLSLSGPVGGTGSLIKSGHDTLILAGTNNYSGTTTVSSGTLQVDGELNSSAGVTVAGGVLGGNGIINVNVAVNPGGTLAPGASAGKLTVNNTVTLAGTTRMEIDRSGPTNDLLVVSTPVTFGGTLVVTNIGDTLMGGETFHLFNAPGFSGSFSVIQLPSIGTGLSWNTSQLAVNGTISVTGTLALPKMTSLAYSGTNVTVSGTQGVANGAYFVLTATDVTLPVASWDLVETNLFDGNGNFSFTNAVDPLDLLRFYRIQLP